MIYFLYLPHVNALKVGYTGSLKNRMGPYKTEYPFKRVMIGVIDGDRKTESEWHTRLAGRRIRGEWFHVDEAFLVWLRREIDIANNAPLTLFNCRVSDVYLAGKITGDMWRKDFFSDEWKAKGEGLPGVNSDLDDEWLTEGCIGVPGYQRRLNYRGPYRLDFTGGHFGGNNPGAHAFGETPEGGYNSEEFKTNAIEVRSRCLAGVKASGLVFAWINGTDCHGTIAEIAYAYALKRYSPRQLPIIAISATRECLGELWFTLSMADWVHCSDSPLDGWNSLWTANKPLPLFHADQPDVTKIVPDVDNEFDSEMNEIYYNFRANTG